MNLWERVTGSDLTRDWRDIEARAEALPADYRRAWVQLKAHLMTHGDFTGRNLTPIVDGVLGLLETSAADGQSVDEVLGADMAGFASAVVGGAGATDYRERWRAQLNRNVARKLSRLGG